MFVLKAAGASGPRYQLCVLNSNVTAKCIGISLSGVSFTYLPEVDLVWTPIHDMYFRTTNCSNQGT